MTQVSVGECSFHSNKSQSTKQSNQDNLKVSVFKGTLENQHCSHTLEQCKALIYTLIEYSDSGADLKPMPSLLHLFQYSCLI